MSRRIEQARAAEGLNAVFPVRQQQALLQAAARGDLRAIDAITDELARMGLCRPRHDCTLPTRARRAQQLAALRGC